MHPEQRTYLVAKEDGRIPNTARPAAVAWARATIRTTLDTTEVLDALVDTPRGGAVQVRMLDGVALEAAVESR